MPGERRPGLGWKVANLIAAVMFGASVAVQINDPDPLPWMAVYGGAAIIALLEWVRPVRPVFPALLSLPALGRAATATARGEAKGQRSASTPARRPRGAPRKPARPDEIRRRAAPNAATLRNT